MIISSFFCDLKGEPRMVKASNSHVAYQGNPDRKVNSKKTIAKLLRAR
jgi:hypothetical protein